MEDNAVMIQSYGLHSARQIDGLTIFNPKTSTYYELSVTAAFIWERFEHPSAIAAVKEATVQKFAVSLHEVGAQIDSFIGEMVSQGLLCVADAEQQIGGK